MNQVNLRGRLVEVTIQNFEFVSGTKAKEKAPESKEKTNKK